MELLVDENVTREWRRALVGDGHDVVGVLDLDEREAGTPDRAVLEAAVERDRILLTADQSDFSDPPLDDHAGVVVVTDIDLTGGEVRRAVRRVETTVPDLAGQVVYVGDWL